MKFTDVYLRHVYALMFALFGVALLIGFKGSLNLVGAFSIGEINWMHVFGFYAVMFFSSFVSGLSGFGFSAVGAFLLLFMQPSTSIALLMLLSLFTQMLSAKKLWKELRPNVVLGREPESLMPYLIGGVLATPFGVYFLNTVEPKIMMMSLGVILASYSLYSLLKPAKMVLNVEAGWKKSLAVGAAGGLVGGFSAFPGSALVVWTGIQNMPKEKTRALTQPYIVTMQVIGLVAFISHYGHVFNLALLGLMLTAMPIVYFGNSYGLNKFSTIDQASFRKVTFGILGLAGAVLILKAVLL